MQNRLFNSKAILYFSNSRIKLKLLRASFQSTIIFYLQIVIINIRFIDLDFNPGEFCLLAKAKFRPIHLYGKIVDHYKLYCTDNIRLKAMTHL